MKLAELADRPESERVIERPASIPTRPPEPDAAYKAAVDEAAASTTPVDDLELPDVELLRANQRLPRHFRHDVQRRRKWNQAVAELEKVPDLQRQADAIVVPPRDAAARTPLKDLVDRGATVGELGMLLDKWRHPITPPEKIQRNDLLATIRAIQSNSAAVISDLSVRPDTSKLAAELSDCEGQIRSAQERLARCKRRDEMEANLYSPPTGMGPIELDRIESDLPAVVRACGSDSVKKLERELAKLEKQKAALAQRRAEASRAAQQNPVFDWNAT